MTQPVRILVALCAAALTAANAQARTCLHDDGESAAERQRRLDAMQAVQLLNNAQAAAVAAPGGRFRALFELAQSAVIASARSDGGTLGRVARAMNWGGADLLPGWRLNLVVTDDSYALTLRDVRDVCGFTLSSEDDGVIVQGYPVMRGPAPALPPSP